MQGLSLRNRELHSAFSHFRERISSSGRDAQLIGDPRAHCFITSTKEMSMSWHSLMAMQKHFVLNCFKAINEDLIIEL